MQKTVLFLNEMYVKLHLYCIQYKTTVHVYEVQNFRLCQVTVQGSLLRWNPVPVLPRECNIVLDVI